jgi:hypothetical protein
MTVADKVSVTIWTDNPEFLRFVAMFKLAMLFISALTLTVFVADNKFGYERLPEQRYILMLGIALIFYNDPFYYFSYEKPNLYRYYTPILLKL